MDYLSHKNRQTKTAPLAVQQQKDHIAYHTLISPISIPFLGLSKFIISSAPCASVSSLLSYWHCFCTHYVWVLPSVKYIAKSLLVLKSVPYTCFKPRKGWSGLRIHASNYTAYFKFKAGSKVLDMTFSNRHCCRKDCAHFKL